MPPGPRTTFASTIGTSTRARCTRLVVRLPLRSHVSDTTVPALPLILAVAWSDVWPPIRLPFTATITSPARSPACLAGESSNTRMICSPRLTSCTVMPTPSNSPLVVSWNFS